mgnify:CR=1 FL=1
MQWRGAEFWQRRMGTRSEHACKHLPYRRSSSRSSSRRHATTASTAASAPARRLRSSCRNDPWAREWRVCHIHAHQVLELSPPAPRTPDCLRRRRLPLVPLALRPPHARRRRRDGIPHCRWHTLQRRVPTPTSYGVVHSVRCS